MPGWILPVFGDWHMKGDDIRFGEYCIERQEIIIARIKAFRLIALTRWIIE